MLGSLSVARPRSLKQCLALYTQTALRPKYNLQQFQWGFVSFLASAAEMAHVFAIIFSTYHRRLCDICSIIASTEAVKRAGIRGKLLL